MATPGDITLYALLRNGFVLAGLLVLGVGLGDMVAGRAKLAEYRLIIANTPPPKPKNPAALFPTASEAQERQSMAEAKLGFYELLFLVGQILAALGLLLVAIGAFQLRLRALRPEPETLGLH
ncbi:MAG TPA: hypothetical protein VGR62_12395 [Candidatus Binatia bacterium]|nr:hypothetical protein [Candidatus Binatia bacterium]